MRQLSTVVFAAICFLTSVVVSSEDVDVCQSDSASEHQKKSSMALLQVSATPKAEKDHTKPAHPHPVSLAEDVQMLTKMVANIVKTPKAPKNEGEEREHDLLLKMVRSDPWSCEFIPQGDARKLTCGLAPDAESLNPQKLTCGNTMQIDRTVRCSIEHANAFRTLYEVGALPCCSTPPFCSAPVCDQANKQKLSTCTKRDPSANVGFMITQEAWPAYHGWGGSFELDTLKLLDAIDWRTERTKDKAFDLAIDLGANTGYYTEKLTVRGWAKNYILVEANPNPASTLRSRWNDDAWKERWFTEQVEQEDGPTPDFEVINHALSNHSTGLLDMCQTESAMRDTACKVPIASVDHLFANVLSPTFQEHLAKAQSAYIKVDTEGMDELVMRGMQNLLNQRRGEFPDKTPKFLVNFMQFEFSPALMKKAKEREGFSDYDIKTATKFLESMGFETFLIGPRYLPLSHGSWKDEFKTWTEDVDNNAGMRKNYKNFGDEICPWCARMTTEPSFTSDIFAMRSSHPRAAALKVALGACKESKDFDWQDSQYAKELF